ncbi:MAG: urea ABC transporter permease subunit UrtB [Burkholderiales bacterium]|nr:urea ABC transporter permease subunit UrtB [Burkholderiales bacterium]MDE2197586.1 urea ABC transporter permease subunit UrtB [Rhodospirillales bacterium]
MKSLLTLLAVLLLALAPPAARAQTAPDLFTGFTSQSFDDVIRAVRALAASGHPEADATLTALQNDNLYVGADGVILIQTRTGYTDARSGKPVSGINPDDLNSVQVSNAVREAVSAALGTLNLLSPDRAARLNAAGEVFKSRNPMALPALARAIAQEKDGTVLAALREAQAAAALASPASTPDERLAAVRIIALRGGMQARALLASIGPENEAVAAAAAAGIAAIDRSQQLWGLAQSVFYGVSLGSVLLLAAAGLAITFGVMGIINMAHGEMVMLGAYTTYVTQQMLNAYAPALFGASLVIAVPLAFLVSALVGIAIERCLIRFLYGRPLETLLATWGLSLVLQQAVRSIFGASNREVSTPGWMSGTTQWGGLAITANRLTIIIFSALVLAALMAALRFTPLGLRMRAVTQNRRMAAAMGIRTPWIDALTFALGSGVAGMAGVALSQIDNVSPNLGQGYIIDSFMVVVFGGVGNLWGTVVSALTLGVVNKFLEPVAGAVLGKIVVLVLLILFIQRRPRGLFPLKGRAVEA